MSRPVEIFSPSPPAEYAVILTQPYRPHVFSLPPHSCRAYFHASILSLQAIDGREKSQINICMLRVIVHQIKQHATFNYRLRKWPGVNLLLKKTMEDSVGYFFHFYIPCLTCQMTLSINWHQLPAYYEKIYNSGSQSADIKRCNHTIKNIPLVDNQLKSEHGFEDSLCNMSMWKWSCFCSCFSFFQFFYSITIVKIV